MLSRPTASASHIPLNPATRPVNPAAGIPPTFSNRGGGQESGRI